jgi:RNA recognition motif-containing protein
VNFYSTSCVGRPAEHRRSHAGACGGPATIIKDKFSGESRGSGFVEMPNKEEADKAISGLNGKDLKGRPLTVNEARPRTDRPRTGGGGGGRGGFDGGRYRSRGDMYASYKSHFLIRHLELTFAAAKPRPAHVFAQVALMAAEESGEYE